MGLRVLPCLSTEATGPIAEDEKAWSPPSPCPGPCGLLGNAASLSRVWGKRLGKWTPRGSTGAAEAVQGLGDSGATLPCPQPLAEAKAMGSAWGVGCEPVGPPSGAVFALPADGSPSSVPASPWAFSGAHHIVYLILCVSLGVSRCTSHILPDSLVAGGSCRDSEANR